MGSVPYFFSFQLVRLVECDLDEWRPHLTTDPAETNRAHFKRPTTTNNQLSAAFNCFTITCFHNKLRLHTTVLLANSTDTKGYSALGLLHGGDEVNKKAVLSQR